MCFTPQCLTRTAMKDSAALQFPHLGRAVTAIAPAEDFPCRQ